MVVIGSDTEQDADDIQLAYYVMESEKKIKNKMQQDMII